MADNNIIDMPTSEELREKTKKGNSVILNMIQKNRASGLERADSALRQLDGVQGIASDPNAEARLRALETGVRGLATSLDALNNFCDIIGRDLIALLTNLDQQMAAGALQGLWLQTLIDVMKEKGLVADEELQRIWTQLRDEMNAGRQRPATDSTAPKSPQ